MDWLARTIAVYALLHVIATPRQPSIPASSQCYTSTRPGICPADYFARVATGIGVPASHERTGSVPG